MIPEIKVFSFVKLAENWRDIVICIPVVIMKFSFFPCEFVKNAILNCEIIILTLFFFVISFSQPLPGYIWHQIMKSTILRPENVKCTIYFLWKRELGTPIVPPGDQQLILKVSVLLLSFAEGQYWYPRISLLLMTDINCGWPTARWTTSLAVWNYWVLQMPWAGPCITTATWRCPNNFSQWGCSFHWKLRCHWLEFLRQRQITLVRQGPGIR